MKITGNIEITLKKNEKPDFYINVSGNVKVMYKTWFMDFNGKPDFDLFWANYYEENKFDFEEEFLSIKQFLADQMKNRDPKKQGQKYGIMPTTVKKFCDTLEISTRGLINILVGKEYSLNITFPDGQTITGNPVEVYEKLNFYIRDICASENSYQISKRTGLHYNFITNFKAGGNLAFEKLARISNYSVKL